MAKRACVMNRGTSPRTEVATRGRHAVNGVLIRRRERRESRRPSPTMRRLGSWPLTVAQSHRCSGVRGPYFLQFPVRDEPDAPVCPATRTARVGGFGAGQALHRRLIEGAHPQAGDPSPRSRCGAAIGRDRWPSRRGLTASGGATVKRTGISASASRVPRNSIADERGGAMIPGYRRRRSEPTSRQRATPVATNSPVGGAAPDESVVPVRNCQQRRGDIADAAAPILDETPARSARTDGGVSDGRRDQSGSRRTHSAQDVGHVLAVERAACQSASRRAPRRTPTRRCACQPARPFACSGLM